jgi:hypothetical protein
MLEIIIIAAGRTNTTVRPRRIFITQKANSHRVPPRRRALTIPGPSRFSIGIGNLSEESWPCD